MNKALSTTGKNWSDISASQQGKVLETEAAWDCATG
jgi:hypothetical protein